MPPILEKENSNPPEVPDEIIINSEYMSCYLDYSNIYELNEHPSGMGMKKQQKLSVREYVILAHYYGKDKELNKTEELQERLSQAFQNNLCRDWYTSPFANGDIIGENRKKIDSILKRYDSTQVNCKTSNKNAHWILHTWKDLQEDSFYIIDSLVENVDFSGINIQNGQFLNVKFKNCKFNYCDMRSMSIEDCDFENVEIRGSQLTGIAIKNEKYKRNYIDKEDLQKRLKFLNVTFFNSLCKGLEIIGYKFEKTQFKECNLTKSRLYNCRLENTSFINTKLNNAYISGCGIHNDTVFDGCDVTGLNFDTSTYIAKQGMKVVDCLGEPTPSAIAKDFNELNKKFTNARKEAIKVMKNISLQNKEDKDKNDNDIETGLSKNQNHTQNKNINTR